MKSPIVGSRFILIATLVVAACSEAAGPTGVADTQFAKGGKGKTNGKGGELTLITYTVETVPGGYGLTDNTSVNDAVYQHLWAEDQAVVWADYLGCPSATKDCSAVTLQMTGSAPLSLVPSAVPVVSGCPGFDICLLDTELQNRRDATVAGGEAMPQIPWDLLAPTVVTNSDDNSWTFTFYWQGQRGRSRTYDTGEQEKVRGRLVPIFETEWYWDTYPDLYPQGYADRFFFHPVFGIGQRTWYHPTFSDAKLLEICDTGRCWAEFRGDPGAGVVTASWTDASVTTDADGQTFLEFSVKATIDSDVNPNPESHGRAMLTHPDGTREMLSYVSRWRSGADAVTSYRVSVGTGCYAIDLVGLIIVEGDKASFVSDNRWVWDGMTPGTLNLGCGS